MRGIEAKRAPHLLGVKDRLAADGSNPCTRSKSLTLTRLTAGSF